jgi:aryl-alcohol dehydrogenase-like predicted oxidoreductase
LSFRKHTKLGRTGLVVSRLGIGAGYRVPTSAVEKAYHEYGVNYFYWDRRTAGMREAIRTIARSDRDKVVIAVQSYDHSGFFLNRSVEKALSTLGVDFADILVLGWYGSLPRRRVIETAERLKERGRVRFLGVSGHKRTFFGELARQKDRIFDVFQVRYNAAHRGAEEDVFPFLPDKDRPGLTTYTATSHGKLLKPSKMPEGEAPLSSALCYRFVLSNPHVDLCMTGPRSDREMDEALSALDEEPLSIEEMEHIRRIGDHVHG